ncbi:MAG: hypothetical protein F9K27_01220 [Anaerolineae bacterium]|nr:MAG: hypothetical protein F9K27_01220 [Anaerolineae bacterium]
MQDRTQPNQKPPVFAPQQMPPPSRPSKPRRRIVQRKRRGCMPGPGCLLGCFGAVGIFTIVLLIGVYVVYYQVSRRLENKVDELEANINDVSSESGFETTFIYDRDGNKLYEVFGQGRRQWVDFEQIPDVVKEATISVEDDDFYNNPGFDVQSNLRAGWQYVRYGQIVSGASTITQQLVRNVFFDPEYRAEQSVERKVDEILLATVMTQKYSKDEILELYLNEIYYGNLAYGIEAAAQTYFGKSAGELELHEAALLAGLPQFPAELNPLNPDPSVQARVLLRQHLVLDLMVEEDYITEAEAESAKQRTLNYVSPDVPLEAPHFTLYAKEELEDLLLSLGYTPEFISNGGLRVYTSIDLEWQGIAQNAAETTVNQLRSVHNMTNSAVVIIHPPSGEILAMVGSVDYNDESIDGQVNMADAPRQPGSTMKPFTYSAMLERGWSPASILWDVQTEFGVQGQANYVPVNYDRRFHGPVRVRDALANSYNIPAVLALRNVGVDYLLLFLRRFGVESLSTDPGQYGLSLTLGGGEITLVEMTNGYATFARQGIYVRPTSILCVIDKNDNILYQYENRCPQGFPTDQTYNAYVSGTPALDPRIAFIISDILADNNARTPAMGANSPLNTGSLLTSVKTGTTNDFRDNWTIGFTHDVAIGVWSGNSDNTPMNNISGLSGAAPIWNDIVNKIYQRFEMPPSVLNPPPGVSQHRICDIRGLRDPAPAGSCGGRSEWLLDSPPLIPDSQGNLVPLQMDSTPSVPPEYGPRLIEVSPDTYEVDVRRLDGNQANLLAAQNPGFGITPTYCMVPVEVLDVVIDEQRQIFIEPPPLEQDRRNAYQYAANAGIPILPPFPCTGDTLAGFAPVAPGVTAQIVSPTPGQTVSGNIQIYGVVNYPDGYFFDYYKIEVRGGPFPDWTTIENVHHNEVLEPGLLETFYAESLPPGPYDIRLYLQGDLFVEPYVVSINLIPPQ